MKAQEIAKLAQYVMETEHQYNLTGDRNAMTLPFMPYQPADFIGILWECMPEITDSRPHVHEPVEGMSRVGYRMPLFLDVGCGPGTKMKIARDMFGFDVRGIEIDAGMAFEAAQALADGHAEIEHGDAMGFTGEYENADLIWLYRPFRDPSSEYKLERHITSLMKPGAVLAGGSWEIDVATLGWHTIVDDCMVSPDGTAKIWRGAWMKPGESTQ